MTIDELIEKSHAMAVQKGWWPDDAYGRSVSEQVNNFHAEIAEAWEEYRHGRMELWWSKKHGPDAKSPWKRIIEFVTVEWLGSRTPASFMRGGYKPEGFWIEIADLVIRLCDTVGAYRWKLAQAPAMSTTNMPYLVAYLNQAISKMCWFASVDGRWSCDTHESESARVIAGFIVASCFASAEQCGVDLWSLIEVKLAYNATREMRHGGLKA